MWGARGLAVRGCSCDGDPVECSHEAARGQAEAELRQVREQQREALASLYRERACLLAALAGVYPAWICANDPGAPGWPVLYVESPAGQLSWHVNRADMDMFGHVPNVDPGADDAPVWDGHTTSEKYARLARLAAAEAAARRGRA